MVDEADFELKTVTDEIFQETTGSWKAEILRLGEDNIGGTSQYYSQLRDLEDAAEGRTVKGADINRKVLCYKDSNIAQSVLDISNIEHGKGAPRLKVLDMQLHPRLDLNVEIERDIEFYKEHYWVVSGSITQALLLIFGENPANELKLYGRTGQMYGYFQGVATTLNRNGGIPGLDIMSHGHWLVFRKKSVAK